MIVARCEFEMIDWDEVEQFEEYRAGHELGPANCDIVLS